MTDHVVIWRPSSTKPIKMTTICDCNDALDASIEFKRAIHDIYPEAVIFDVRPITARWHLPVPIGGGEHPVSPAEYRRNRGFSS